MKNTSRTFKNIGTGVRKEECIINKKKNLFRYLIKKD